MQQPPLPVDVTSTWWDYVVDVADILAGLGAAGALLIAALAYRRQVDDSLRQHANQVVLQEEPDGNVAELTLLKVVNSSDRTIRIVRYDAFPPNLKIERETFPVNVLAGEKFPIAAWRELDSAQVQQTWVDFTDAGGRLWRRYGDGGISQLRRGELMWISLERALQAAAKRMKR